MNTGRRDVIKKRRVNLLRRRIVIVGVTCIAMFLICATFVNLYNVNAIIQVRILYINITQVTRLNQVIH